MKNKAKVRPPLKWAGGKYQVLDQIRKRLPKGGRLIEPFVGSGVVFLNTDYEQYILNDINTDLIDFYKTLKNNGETFIEYARQFFTQENNSESKYYHFREQFNTTNDLQYKSALFLYINKFGYNGLCRYNSSGEINVPFGKYNKPYYPEKEMRFFIEKSKRAKFYNKDFEKIMRSAKPGDLIYCDPPYAPLSKTANFTAYSAGGFNNDEQLRLAHVAEELARSDIPVLISNHYTKFTADAYKNARKYKFPVQRMISCNGSKREPAMEVLAVYRKTKKC